MTCNTGVLDWAGTEEADLQSILDEEDNVKTRIIFAREELKVLYALSCILVFRRHTLIPWAAYTVNASFVACLKFFVRTSNFCRCQMPSVSYLLLAWFLLSAGRHCNCLPTRSSTCARRLVVRKPRDSARKSSRVKWQELPLVSSGERLPRTRSSVWPHCCRLS